MTNSNQLKLQNFFLFHIIVFVITELVDCKQAVLELILVTFFIS